jgi:hypothetical protein
MGGGKLIKSAFSAHIGKTGEQAGQSSKTFSTLIKAFSILMAEANSSTATLSPSAITKTRPSG